MYGYQEVIGVTADKPFDAESFLAYIRRSNSQWWEGVQGAIHCPWVFRGHANANDWHLIASAARPLDINKLAPIIDRMKVWTWREGEQRPTIGSSQEHAVLIHCAALQALEDFAELARSLGLYAYKSGPWLNGRLTSTISDGNASKQALKNETAMLAQHHGIPTFLIDWSRRPETAAHFASSDDSVKLGTKNIAVYALRINECRNDLPFELREAAPIENQFLAAQHGIFTYHADQKTFECTGKYPALENVLSKFCAPQAILLKIVLQADKVPKLRLLLDREGLTDAMLKPTLDHVGRTVLKRWCIAGLDHSASNSPN